MSSKPGEVRLTPAQALKVWDGMFATRWPEIFDGHVLRPLMVKLAKAGCAPPEVLDFIRTGRLDPTVGMPKAARIQRATEGTPEGMSPDWDQNERMHQVASSNPEIGSAVAGSY